MLFQSVLEQILYSFTWYLLFAITRYPFNFFPKWKNVVRTLLCRSVSAAIRGPTKQFWFTINAQLLRIQIESEALFPIFVHSVSFGHETNAIQWYTFSHWLQCCMWRLNATFQFDWNMKTERYCVRCMTMNVPALPPSFKWILRPLHWKSGNKCYSSNFVNSKIRVHFERNSDAVVDC